jgi:hypothetical protein
MRSKDAILRWWQNFFSAAEYFDQSGRIILKGVARTYGTTESSVSMQLERGYAAWCEIQTKWRSSVVGERFCEAVLTSPHP